VLVAQDGETVTYQNKFRKEEGRHIYYLEVTVLASQDARMPGFLPLQVA